MVERVGLMGVVDEDERALVGDADPLQPSRGADERAERLDGDARLDARADGEAGGDEGVRNLETAGERQADMHRRAEDVELERLAVEIGLVLDEANRPPCPAHIDQALPAAARHVHDRLRIGTVRVDDGGAAFRQEIAEQLELGLEIVLDRRMIIHVVAAEIGEGRRRQANAVEPMLIEAVARRLERRVGDALASQPVEDPVKLDRIGRGQAAIVGTVGRDDADGADRGGLPAGDLEDLADKGGDRGLAAGAGDGDQVFRLQGIEAGGEMRQRDARIGGAQHRHAEIVGKDRVGTADDGRSAPLHRIRREAGSIRRHALQRREQNARLDSAAVRRKAGNLDLRLIGGKREVVRS